MNQEFVTLYGKAIIERDILFIRNINVPFSRTTFARIGYDMLFVLVFVLHFFKEFGPMYYAGIIVWGVLAAFRIPDIYVSLVKTSYANRIPLGNIKSANADDDIDGLHTVVTLYLKNGRKRKIIFRKMEEQYELFIQGVTSHSSNLQLA